MKKSLVITIFILFINFIFFHYGMNEVILSQSSFGKEITNTLYKFFVYLLPCLLVIKYLDKKDFISYFKPQLQRFSQKYVYLICLFRIILLIGGKGMSNPKYSNFPIFYVLVVNSIIEELVFRGYIQNILSAQYGKVKGIISQAILFGIVHIPFYYTHYQQGIYAQMISDIGLPIPSEILGPFIVILAIGSPIFLGLLWGIIKDKTKSLRPSIVWHSLHNGILLFL